MVDVDAAGKMLDGAGVGGRHFAAGAIGANEDEGLEWTLGEALQNLGDNDGGWVEVRQGGRGVSRPMDRSGARREKSTESDWP